MKVFWAGVLLFSCAGLGFTQTATRIDGRHHPELVPDNAAYRALFLMHSHFTTEAEIARSEQLHANLGFSTADHQIYDQLLKDFRLQYDNLAQTHNAFIDSTSSGNMDSLRDEMAGLKRSQSILVQTMRAQLAARLSKEGLAKLDAFVQSEKTHMIVGVRSAQ